MTNKRLITALIFTLFSGGALTEDEAGQQITKAHEHVINQAPASHFSGEARFSRFPVMPSPGDVAPATVTFKANAITNWHIHPHGQYLIVTAGEGRTQEWGKPIQTIQKGDVIWCPPGVKHWHGASTHSGMTHIAISPVATDGKNVTWLEKVNLSAEQKAPVQSEETASVSLTSKQLNLIPIAAYTATGNIEKLKPALIKGLDSGLTVNEIKQVFAHQYAYAGFPRSLNGMLTFRSLLEERKKQDIQDKEGPSPSKLADSVDYYKLGEKTLGYLTKSSADQPLFDNFSPTIDYALKAHLFGYLFSRDNLGYLERELIVIGTLSALDGVNAQLNSHLKIARNLGVDKTQMQKIMKTLENDVSPEVARNAEGVWRQLQ